MLLLDLVSVFPINYTCVNTGLPFKSCDSQGDACMTICHTALQASETPGFPRLVLHGAPPVALMDSMEPVGLVHGFFVKPGTKPPPQSCTNACQFQAHHVLLQNNPVIAGCALNYAASVMNVLSTILDVPLRYPLQRIDRQARYYIWDFIIPDLNKDERKFLLHSTKSSENIVYRYAIFLFNMNLTVFRAYFGMSTSHEIATLNNLKSLIEQRLLFTPPNKKTVFSQLLNCYREKEHTNAKQEILL
ncbi:hypothetical protein Ciccas_013611 [Cichlidogyrus casuarinus]|uniref:Uncharacterized protein n=1 Tax=Cichlidogyrus casuarinus TaxID=1844966 RepID=A0ABD2PQ62_9PLAT